MGILLSDVHVRLLKVEVRYNETRFDIFEFRLMYLFVSHSFSLEVIVDVFLTTRDGFRPGNIRLELLVVGPFLMDCR